VPQTRLRTQGGATLAAAEPFGDVGVTVINLPEEADKWAEISNELNAVGAPHAPFNSPCRGKLELLQESERKLFDMNPHDYTQRLKDNQVFVFNSDNTCSGANCGHVGAALSHFRIWHENQDKELVVVAEDDALLIPNAWNTTLEVLRYVAARDPDWATVWFGASKYDYANPSHPEGERPEHDGLWKYPDGLWAGVDYPTDRTRVGATFYAVSKKGMQRAVSNVQRDSSLWRGSDYSMMDQCSGDCWVETGGVLLGCREHVSQTQVQTVPARA